MDNQTTQPTTFNLPFKARAIIATLIITFIPWLYFLASILAEVNTGEILAFEWGGILIYIISLFIFVSQIAKYHPGSKPVHWLTMYKKRLKWTLAYTLMYAFLSGILFMLADEYRYGAIHWGEIEYYEYYMTSLLMSSTFVIMCTVTLMIGWCLWGKFIKQALITEANVRAQEITTGKKRVTNY